MSERRSRGRNETEAEQRRELSAGRDEMQSARKYESRALAETRSVSKQGRKARAKHEQ